MSKHIVNGQFKSDKYPWCWAGFVPLKTTDPMAKDLLKIYAERRRKIDPEFSDDLEAVLRYHESDEQTEIDAEASQAEFDAEENAKAEWESRQEP